MRLRYGVSGLGLEGLAAAAFSGIIDMLAALAAHDNRIELEEETPEYLVGAGMEAVMVEK